VTGADLHGAPDLVRAPQRPACDTAPVSVRRMRLSVNFGLIPATGFHNSDHPLGAGMNMDVLDHDRLAVSPLVPGLFPTWLWRCC
jgi:hypothetical protein